MKNLHLENILTMPEKYLSELTKPPQKKDICDSVLIILLIKLLSVEMIVQFNKDCCMYLPKTVLKDNKWV